MILQSRCNKLYIGGLRINVYKRDYRDPANQGRSPSTRWQTA